MMESMASLLYHHEVIINNEIIIILTIMQRNDYWKSHVVTCSIKMLIFQKWYGTET